MSKNQMDVWLFRQNARRKMEFGVHELAWNKEKGVSSLRHYAVHNPAYAKVMVREVIECLHLMQGSRFREHLVRTNATAVPFYRQRKSA